MSRKLTVGEYAKQFQDPARNEKRDRVLAVLTAPFSLAELAAKLPYTDTEILAIVRSHPRLFAEREGKIHRR